MLAVVMASGVLAQDRIYVKAAGGVNTFGKTNISPQEDLEGNWGVAGLTAAGVEFGNLALESEFALRLTNGDVDPTGFSAPFELGDVRTASLMANAWYHVPLQDDRVFAYGGAGVGLARSEIRLENRGEDELATVEGEGIFAWQIGAGLKYRLDNGVDLGAGYRYFSEPSTDFGDNRSATIAQHSVLAEISVPIISRGGGERSVRRAAVTPAPAPQPGAFGAPQQQPAANPYGQQGYQNPYAQQGYQAPYGGVPPTAGQSNGYYRTTPPRNGGAAPGYLPDSEYPQTFGDGRSR